MTMISDVKGVFLACRIRILTISFCLFTSLILLLACAPKSARLNVQLMWNQQKLSCNAALPEHPEWQLAQIQFYLSGLTNNGDPVSFLSPFKDKQRDEVLLLGTDCQSEGMWQLPLTRALQPGKVSFEIGVPLALNHQNPLRASPPLNQSDMFWTWQLGHKFFRLDLQKTDKFAQEQLSNEGAVTTGWQFHLGSTGCQSASAMRAPTQACTHPHRPQIQLEYRGEHTLVLDLAPLLFEVLNDTHLTRQSCMSDPNMQVCQALLPPMGINGTSQMWRWQ